MADVIMPKMGDAMEEGVIVQWLKKVGDAVSPEDPIVEIETDKSNVEITADSQGFIQSFAYQAGDTVPVGKTIAIIGAEAGAKATEAPAAPVAPESEKSALAESSKASPVPAAPSEATAKTNGSGSAPTPAASGPMKPAAAPVAAVKTTASAVSASTAQKSPLPKFDSFVGGLPVGLGGSASVLGDPVAIDGESSGAVSNERVKATPVARAMAQANNLDLAALQGSGPDGAIGKADVEAALASGTAAPAPQAQTAPAATPAPTTSAAPAANEGDEVQEYNAMRRTIAKRLAESKSTIPHFYVTSEIDMENMFALREQVNAGAGDGQAKATVTDFLVKAVAVALGENPVVNSFFADNKRTIKKAVNIGIAVSIDDGLIVPVIRSCESKSLRAIARDTRPLIEKARTGKLTPADYTGGTFTISNLGQYDVENFAAIINPGEGAILAVSSIRLVPAVVDGQIVPRRRMKVTLCADHRVMDGVAGALFLQSLKRGIENPLQMLA